MGKLIAWLLRIIAKAWAYLRDLNLVLTPCRFSLFVVLAGGALLLVTPQGREISVRLPDQGVGKVLLFYLCVFVWAFQSWYWARFILDALFGADRRLVRLPHPRVQRIRWLIDHVPRAIAFLAYAVAISACLFSGKKAAVWIGLALLPQGMLFYYALIRRRDLTSALVTRYPRASSWLLARPDQPVVGVGGLAPLSRGILYATLVAGAGLTAWAWAYPVGLGWLFGSSAMPFLGFSMIVPPGSLAVYASRQGGVARLGQEPHEVGRPGRGYPVVTLMVLVAIVFSVWVDNHQVRRLTDAAPHSGRSVSDAVDRWLAQAPRNPDRSVDVVVVATAGGGIRAAYWTATVLGAIQDKLPAFRQQLLAISGVSGGSLGATVFVTLLSEAHWPDAYSRCAPGTARQRPDVSWTRGPHECAGQSVLAQDFLAPVAAALLFTDLIQRFLPVAFLPDRARALEQAWERAWPEAQFERDVWSARGLDQLWPKEGHVPSLLLNGTHVETGKRVITSNLSITATKFPDTYDFFTLLPGPIRISTAALNSARFTYVAPAGTLGTNGRIVDGGYFENFGAETARDVLRATLRRLTDKGVVAHPIVVLITNDPQLKEREMPATGADAATRPAGPASRGGASWASEILSPIRALLATEDAHGILATHDLASVAGPAGLVFHFRLCRDEQASEPALGWVLSAESELLMREQLRTADCGNAAQFDQLVKRLAKAAGRP